MNDAGAYASLHLVSIDDSSRSPEFVNVVESSYMCVECHRPLVQACQTPCGHRICSPCVSHIYGSGKSQMCPANEDGCETMRANEIKPDFSARRFMSQMQVYCCNRQHGCDVIIPWKHLKEHLQANCQYSYTVCPLSCGETQLFRFKVDEHLLSSCTKQIRNCRFESLGCKFHGTRSELEGHLKENGAAHLELALGHITDLTLRNTKLSGNVEELKNEVSQLKGLCSQLASFVESLKQRVDVNATHVLQLEQSMNSSSFTRDGTTTTEEQSVHERLANVEKRVQNLTVSDGRRPTHGTVLPENVRLQLINQDRTIGLHDVRLAEMDLRLQCTETTNYDGVLIWKITDYGRRKQDAISGGTISLYSQPFFTSRYGYKLCARVYLNGDGTGRGTHVSFFLVVMQGDYDELLPWPFRQRVTLCLMDQRTQRRHLADTFRPDPSSSSFQKPTSHMNVASGCPKFVEHAQLEVHNSVYLVNDTLFFKIVVDTSDLLNP